MKAGVWAVVVAAGKGERLGLGYNKALLELSGRTVVSRCLDALKASGCFEGIVLVIGSEEEARFREVLGREGTGGLVRKIVPGGASRRESVWRGLQALPGDTRIVAIHDAARCFVPGELVRRTVESAEQYGSGVAACAVTDTVKRIDKAGLARETIPRNQLRAVQTPQTFRFDIIKKAHEAVLLKDAGDITDDAGLVEGLQGSVRLVESAPGTNPKMTTPEDVQAARARLMSSLRTGQGWDAHRLAEDRDLVLCGVRIPYAKGLLGHSDADVATHALMDALLGAAALGDIGKLFSDQDETYRGADSIVLLTKVVEALREKGWYIQNVDLTIIAQEPKLSPYRDVMRSRIADAMNIALERVSVKASTSERMGFEGRGEGISAMAVAVITE